MVVCVMVGCFNRSERDKGAYCLIPKIRTREGPLEYDRSAERRRLWLKAIGRKKSHGVNAEVRAGLLETLREW
jgi:hypothetical protein